MAYRCCNDCLMIGLLRQGSQLLLGLPVTTGTEIAAQLDEKRGFEEIGAQPAVRFAIFPPTRLLARVDGSPCWPIHSESPVTRESFSGRPRCPSMSPSSHWASS